MSKQIKRELRNWDDYVREAIEDPKLAAEYLNAAAEDEDGRVFMIALKHVIDVYGGLSNLARKARLNRGSLHRALTGKGNVKFDTLHKTLAAAGFQITFRPMRKTIRENMEASGRGRAKLPRKRA